MRWIQKRIEPREFMEWRIESLSHNTCSYDLMRNNKPILAKLEEVLLREQGHLCAYTGLRIDTDSFHIEHILPQAHCHNHEDVDYRNMVACFPAPNPKIACGYGATHKKDWPSLDEMHLLVSPLSQNCEERFVFNLQGIVGEVPGDAAAHKTIQKLNLNHPALQKQRKLAIQGILGKNNNLPLSDARKRLQVLEERYAATYLEPFVFVIKQALKKHIHRLEIIRRIKKEHNERKRTH